MINKKIRRVLILILFMTLPASAFFFSSAFGQESDKDSIQAVSDTLQDFGLFTKTDLMHLALRFDLKQYTRKKPKDEYLKAVLTYYINEKDSVNKEVRLKSRGEFRNGYCSFPPIRLNFSKADLKRPDLKKIDKIKLVTHCQSGNEEYLFKEYLIYKLFNVLTDNSFRVRLAAVDYISTTQKDKVIRTYGFFIEPIEILAERLKTVPVESPALNQKNIIPEMMDRVAIFNYMIGNTDWSVPGQHNVRVLSGNTFDTPGLGTAIPYDFDYSGLVNAHYAIPTEGLGIDNVTQRRFLGICRPEENFKKALKEFSDKKSDFYKVINDFEYLSDKEKKGMINYLDEFYHSLEKIDGILNIFNNECKEF
jgi:hypothetical protein